MDKFLISKMIRFHRKKSGLSQSGLAMLSGVGKTAVFDIEKGKLTVKLETLLKVLNILNIQMEFTSPLMKDFREVSNEKS